MATIRAFTTIEQSRKLAEILPIESADMYHFIDNILELHKVGFGYIKITADYSKAKLEYIPCWSLAALLSILPPKIGAEEPMVIKMYYASEPKERYICQYSLTNITGEYNNPVDACYEMILKLHELKML